MSRSWALLYDIFLIFTPPLFPLHLLRLLRLPPPFGMTLTLEPSPRYSRIKGTSFS